MKKSYLMILILMSQQLSASSTLGSLTDFQGSYDPNPPKTDSSSQIRTSSESSSEENGRCEENDQTSMPLAFATSLIMDKSARFNIDYSPRTAKLSVGAPSMISNCSSMVEWRMKEQEIKGQKTHVLEAKFREGDKCADGACTYKVAKVSNGEFQKYEDMQFAPNLKGYEACLKASGVINQDGKVDQKAIYSAPFKQTFNNVKDTGKLLFVSHGPQSAMIKGKFGDFELINRCDHYEKVDPQITQLLSYEDESRMKLDEEANKLKDCGVDEYHKLIGFIERYDEYASILGAVRDNLIMEAAKKVAKKIEEGKYTEEDLKILADFEQYIVNPKVNQAIRLYQQMENLEGDAKRAKQEELKIALNDVAALNNKPYFVANHTQKLLNDGRFEEAEKMNGIKITLDNYRKLGTRQNNVVITPDIAMISTVNAKDEFAKSSIVAQERYQIRTGQLTGQTDYYNNLVKKLQNSIQVRTQNYQAEIQNEYARIVPGGYCYAYYRNTQKCIQDSMERMQELQNLLQHYNKVDAERIAEYQQSADEYAKLEAEGRRYVAQQNGEPIPDEPQAGRNIATDTTAPPQRAAVAQTEAAGSSNMVNMANQLAQMYQQQLLQQQQQSQMGGQWWNQQSMQGGGGINFNFGAQAQYGSNMMGNMNNPYQAQAYNYYRGF